MVDREPWATFVTGPGDPTAGTRRTRSSTPSDPLPSSSQDTTATFRSSKATETCPRELPVLTRTGFAKVAPPSFENATCVRAEFWASVYQAIATRSPTTAAAAPFTGQALIFQLSGFRIFDGSQLLFSKRITAISRM